ncbi:MAG: dTDP-4-amino-4,6-dideoxygalactose transaminase [Planctomycetota bacterium]
MKIPFVEPTVGAAEARALVRALRTGRIVGNGELSKRVQQKLAEQVGTKHALLTPNATQAFELFLHTTDIGPGDEVVMPSYSYVSMANAVVTRGARPVFCEIEEDTLGADPDSVAACITERTKLVFVVHYAGAACDLGRILPLCAERGVPLFEDAAQAIGSTWRGRHVGTNGVGACFSFHATKNVTCGEGGAFVTDDTDRLHVAEIAHEKGTNRSAFLRGEVDKYTWVGRGGSYVLADLLAAMLDVQLDRTEELNLRRRVAWQHYHEGLADLEKRGVLRRPRPRDDGQHNGHIYWFLAESTTAADRIIGGLREHEIHATFHYQPLHAAPFAREFLGAAGRELPVTERVADTIVRLPLSSKMGRKKVDRVLAELAKLV